MDDLIRGGALLPIARGYVSQGVSVIPVKADGSKAPRFSGWREYATRLPTDDELAGWFGGPGPVGIGAVCGRASGNLVVLDFEHRGGACVYAEWLRDLPPDLAAHVAGCPVIRTPSGGRHIWVRLPELVEGGVMARYANKKTKIEVRGEGHQVLAPGCPGECHRSGNAYVFESRGWVQ